MQNQSQHLQTTQRKCNPERDDQLWSLKKAHTPRREMGLALGVSQDAVGSRLRELSKERGSAVTPSWTDERTKLLKELWAIGVSASIIATKLGGTTRSAVIGKARRLGLASRKTTSRINPPPRMRVPKPAKIIRPPQFAFVRPRKPKNNAAAIILPAEPPLMLPLLALKDGDCRYPIGDPLKPGFGFCGHPKTHGAYCSAHASLSYKPEGRRK